MFSYYFNSRELKTAVEKLFADNAHREYGAAADIFFPEYERFAFCEEEDTEEDEVNENISVFDF